MWTGVRIYSYISTRNCLPIIIFLYKSHALGKKKPRRMAPTDLTTAGSDDEDDLELKGASRLESLLERLISSAVRDRSDRESSDTMTKAQKTARLVKSKYKKGQYVHLGALVLESDPNFKEPDTLIQLSDLTSLKAKQKFTLPTTWPRFILLFTRLLKGYICNGHADRAGELFEYLENLAIHHNVGSCSVTALIKYDDRVRSLSTSPFSWLKFNHQLFEVVKAEFPMSVMGGTRPSAKPQDGRQRGRSSPVPDEMRTKHGLCRDWANRGTCSYDKSKIGCRFAHWCTHKKCVASKKTDHKPSSCPHAGEE